MYVDQVSLLVSKNVATNSTDVWRSVVLRKSTFDESFRLIDKDYSTYETKPEETDILNSSKHPLKSNKIIVLWSCLISFLVLIP